MRKTEILRLLNKARYYHNYLEEEKKAIKICDKILKEHPENRDVLLVKAGSLSCLNKEKESFQLVTKIIERWPKHWEAYYLMGLLLFNTNEKTAMNNFIKSIELKKKFDNVIAAAQLAYFMQDEGYKILLEDAKKIDASRYKNYMNGYWEWEVY